MNTRREVISVNNRYQFRRHPVSLEDLDARDGVLVVYVGPMCSGKSGAMIESLHMHELNGLDVQAFKPVRDSRDGSAIRSRSGASFPAVSISHAAVVKDVLAPDTRVVAFDEPHMMAEGFVQAVLDLKMRGLLVKVAGLNLDWRGQPLPPMPELLCYADKVVSAEDAYCSRCKASAVYSHRITQERDLIVPGGEDKYEPLCPECWLAMQREDDD